MGPLSTNFSMNSKSAGREDSLLASRMISTDCKIPGMWKQYVPRSAQETVQYCSYFPQRDGVGKTPDRREGVGRRYPVGEMRSPRLIFVVAPLAIDDFEVIERNRASIGLVQAKVNRLNLVKL
jgi:hypothetical protein